MFIVNLLLSKVVRLIVTSIYMENGLNLRWLIKIVLKNRPEILSAFKPSQVRE